MCRCRCKNGSERWVVGAHPSFNRKSLRLRFLWLRRVTGSRAASRRCCLATSSRDSGSPPMMLYILSLICSQNSCNPTYAVGRIIVVHLCSGKHSMHLRVSYTLEHCYGQVNQFNRKINSTVAFCRMISTFIKTDGHQALPESFVPSATFLHPYHPAICDTCKQRSRQLFPILPVTS
jgi:hypothetical protein